jgi:hypothetical protein
MASNYLISTSGSANWGTAANWSLLSIPANTEDVTLANSSAAIDAGLLQSGVTLGSLSVPQTFTGSCGLATQTPRAPTAGGITRASSTATVNLTAHGFVAGDTVTISGAGESEYNGTFAISNISANAFDYTVSGTPSTPASGTIAVTKNSYLKIAATRFSYGDAGNGATSATGSGRFKIDFGSAQTAASILNTRSSGLDANLEPLRILGSHASNTLAILAGLCGIATSTPDETATFATINVVGGKLNGGAGLTWGTINQTEGTLSLKSGGTTFTQSGGTATLAGTGTVTTATIGGTLNLNLRKATAGDTVTTLNLTDGAVLDLSGNPANLAIGTLAISGSVTIKCNLANPGHLTWTTLTRNPGSRISFE